MPPGTPMLPNPAHNALVAKAYLMCGGGVDLSRTAAYRACLAAQGDLYDLRASLAPRLQEQLLDWIGRELMRM